MRGGRLSGEDLRDLGLPTALLVIDQVAAATGTLALLDPVAARSRGIAGPIASALTGSERTAPLIEALADAGLRSPR